LKSEFLLQLHSKTGIDIHILYQKHPSKFLYLGAFVYTMKNKILF
jgi:hypothetical protein